MSGRAAGKNGYALLAAIIAVHIFAILLLMLRGMWETEIQRDLEAELLFRARQYKTAIELFVKKNNNLYPRELKTLYEKRFLRKLFEDPMSEEGKWNIVMQGTTGRKKELLIVPEEMLEQYLSKARIVGVASTSPEEGFKVYRGKKRYSEWAVYVGEKPEKEMPELKFAGEGDDSAETKDDLPRAGDKTDPSGRK
ncbi:MAG: hypothetical protein GY757_54380 [bacterium]|nr:hypothetical protein [bacterium]